jgi:membrane glycosyltransferase
VWRPDWALALLAVTGVILFLPKLLSIMLIVPSGAAPRYGDAVRLTLRVLLEILFSSLWHRFAWSSTVAVVQNLPGAR